VLLHQGEDIKTLTELGLTLSQAKVYFAAASSRKVKAKDLSEESGVPRQELYRILTELLKLGLIEKEISNPTRFIALPLSKGAEVLFARKREEVLQLEAKTKVLMYENDRAGTVETPQSQLCILPRKYMMENRGRHSYANAKKCIRFLAPVKRLADAFTYHIDVYSDAVDRDVEMRVITEKIDNSEYIQLRKTAAALFSQKNFEMKFVSPLDALAISIIDDKESYFALDPKKRIFDDQLLWTNNESLILLACKYFDGLWNFAAEP
jgi:sugar-specific transcriptional regulator TrmB